MSGEALQSVTILISRRDAIQLALDELDKTPIANYGIDSRNVQYAERESLEKQIRQLNRRIGARDPSIQATGFNYADFRTNLNTYTPTAE
jgi:hypothetical protein